jgi:EAL domain-containing protein (putative c-di-GMP-specific phosphodiesterase class I)/AmiR/NasT family two-component response regulator
MTTALVTKKPTILIVEDELIVAENLAQSLKKLGYPISTIVNSGEQAIQAVTTHHPDLILMDIMLVGDIDGIEAALQISLQFKIPVVYMTAYADQYTLERAKKTEPYGYLVKPFKPQDIQTTIEIAFQRYLAEKKTLLYHHHQLEQLQNKLENLLDKQQTDIKNTAIKPQNKTTGLAQDLQQAIKQKQLQLYYQPQVDLNTGIVIGAEALLRWFHPEKGMISPNTFIPIAEETGLIIEIDEWVFTTACQQIDSLHQKGFTALKVAVNLSGEQFKTDNLNQRLLKILENINLMPEFIEIELTESTLINDVALGIQNLQGLKELGITVSVDDFGTGYSSLSYLKHFAFDILKIDRSFIQDINQDLKQQAIVKAMISMAHQLDLIVIGEGVETEAELSFLQNNNCNAAQGYFISKPLPWLEFQQYIQQSRVLPVSI